MTDTFESEEDAITSEEITGISIPSSTETVSTTPPTRNAFSALMSPQPKHPSRAPPALSSTYTSSLNPRNNLGAYISSPTSFPPSTVLSHTPTSVVINDRYPKSSVHILLLPRDASKTLLHPLSALQNDPAFLSQIQTEVSALRQRVASELRRLYGKYSAGEIARREAMERESAPAPGGDLPPGRDWSKSIISGVHLSPSMNHLHIHILSTDRFSPCMKHRKHYNSFNTPFLIPVEDFPLGEGDERLKKGVGRTYLESELRCWRCGKGFGNRFARLKEHLEEEFDKWKRE